MQYSCYDYSNTTIISSRANQGPAYRCITHQYYNYLISVIASSVLKTKAKKQKKTEAHEKGVDKMLFFVNGEIS